MKKKLQAIKTAMSQMLFFCHLSPADQDAMCKNIASKLDAGKCSNRLLVWETSRTI